MQINQTKVRLVTESGHLVKESIVPTEYLIHFFEGTNSDNYPSMIFGHNIISIGMTLDKYHESTEYTFVVHPSGPAPKHIHAKPIDWSKVAYDLDLESYTSGNMDGSYDVCELWECAGKYAQKAFIEREMRQKKVSKERLAEILEAAADRLLVDGWCQGELHKDEDGNFCLPEDDKITKRQHLAL